MIDDLKKLNIPSLLLRSDVVTSLGLVGILMVMIIPLPSILLDLFLAANITVSLLILIVAIYTAKALDFGIFPSVLLATTLFRLSLNVASTRLILLHGNEGASAAGSVIQSFGQFVVGGNYVVGLVIFSILVVINFMVITKGAGRVAEVSARFTLDAMPGKQMAIDADLNAGLITDDMARARRKEVSQEAEFYGAMDGASKFVRGDAIAGIIITVINIGAGFIIGVLQQGMPAAQAATNYTILTVGDGLVGQIPALIISTAAGLLVTRTSGSENFGAELKRQFSVHPQALWVVSGILFCLALVPGLPHLAFIFLAVMVGLVAYKTTKTQQAQALIKRKAERAQVPPEEPEPDYKKGLPYDLLQIEVGYGLIPFVDEKQNGELLQRIKGIRKQLLHDMGFSIPKIPIKDNLRLAPNSYSIVLKGVNVASGELMPDQYLAMDAGQVTEHIKGFSVKDPTFGIPAVWLPENKKDRAQLAGYTVVDCTTVIATHISEIIKRHAHEFMGRQETQNLLDGMAEINPKLVEELVPGLLNLGTVMRVLQNLLQEDVSIRDLRSILETLADWATITQDSDKLTEYVRRALSRAISASYADEHNNLNVMTLSRDVQDALLNAADNSGDFSYLPLEPAQVDLLIRGIRNSADKFTGGKAPVLACHPAIRPQLKKLTSSNRLTNLAVLSFLEIDSLYNVTSLETITINAS